MADYPREEFEGRLTAHRKLLAALLAELGDGAGLDRIRSFLDDRSIFQDNEEDPGVLPNQAYAVEAAQADEMRLIREEMDRHRRRQDR